jgi:putative ABC transport system substrate-binding protein
MRRREFITLLGGAVAWPVAARAQQKLARIGFLRQAAPHEKQFEAFREGLRAAGYIEGQNIVIEQRYARVRSERRGRFAGGLRRDGGLARGRPGHPHRWNVGEQR